MRVELSQGQSETFYKMEWDAYSKAKLLICQTEINARLFMKHSLSQFDTDRVRQPSTMNND